MQGIHIQGGIANDRQQYSNRFKYYVSLLQHYANMKALSKGKQIHGHMLLIGFDQSVSIGFVLVSMYATHGSMADTYFIDFEP